MKSRPTFSISRRCSAAMRRIETFIDAQAAAEAQRTASDFRQLRASLGVVVDSASSESEEVRHEARS